MDVPEAETEANGNVFLHFIYGFLVLLGISILVSLGKAIYHFCKVRKEHKMGSTDDTIDTECHSISNEPSVSERPSETNVQESYRLRLQLDKLRRLLNRLNAMGTFSRDTIGDLSAESAVRVNNSKAASSDMSEFWSSIDFDEFDDSTINDGKFGKTQRDKSVSPSISDFSLDTSGIPFDNARHKNFATSSRENVLNVSSAIDRRTNPSDAIIQILTILDSIMLKNRNCERPLKNNFKIEKQSDKSLNSQTVSEALYLPESSTSEQKLNLPTFVSINKKFYTNESLNSNTVITMPEDRNFETLNSDKLVDSVLTSKSLLLEQLPPAKDLQYKIPSAVSLEAKISKVMSVVNITSTCGSKRLYSTKLPSSSKSLNNISISQSVSFCVDPFTCLSTRAKVISKSVSSASENQCCKDVLSKPRISEISPCALDVEAINRSHSLSDLLDKTLLSIESNIEQSCSYAKEPEIRSLKPENNSNILKTLSESSRDSQKHPHQKTKISSNENEISNSTQEINNGISSSVSSRSLHSPLALNFLTLKSSVSEPEIKQSQFLGMHSPNLSSSGSDAFLSPLVIDISPSGKTDWKSPVELNSDTVIHNLTPHNENAMPSRKSCIWSTPPLPLPKEIVTDEIII